MYYKNTQALLVASKEMDLEVNTDKAMYVIVSRSKKAEQNHNIKIDNKSFERMDQFRVLGITLRYQNSVQEKIKSRLKSGNACYHSVQNLKSSSFLSKILRLSYTTIILACCFLWV